MPGWITLATFHFPFHRVKGWATEGRRLNLKGKQSVVIMWSVVIWMSQCSLVWGQKVFAHHTLKHRGDRVERRGKLQLIVCVSSLCLVQDKHWFVFHFFILLISFYFVSYFFSVKLEISLMISIYCILFFLVNFSTLLTTTHTHTHTHTPTHAHTPTYPHTHTHTHSHTPTPTHTYLHPHTPTHTPLPLLPSSEATTQW